MLTTSGGRQTSPTELEDKVTELESRRMETSFIHELAEL
jgi:hypothetical protein